MENLCKLLLKLLLKLLFNDESAEKSAVECRQVYDYTTHVFDTSPMLTYFSLIFSSVNHLCAPCFSHEDFFVVKDIVWNELWDLRINFKNRLTGIDWKRIKIWTRRSYPKSQPVYDSYCCLVWLIFQLPEFRYLYSKWSVIYHYWAVILSFFLPVTDVISIQLCHFSYF